MALLLYLLQVASAYCNLLPRLSRFSRNLAVQSFLAVLNIEGLVFMFVKHAFASVLLDGIYGLDL